jgi:hypothetical protein
LHNSTFPVRGSGCFDFLAIHSPERSLYAEVLLEILRYKPGKGGYDRQCNYDVEDVLGTGYIEFRGSHSFAPLKKGPGCVPIVRSQAVPKIFSVQYQHNIRAPAKSSLFFLTPLSPRYASCIADLFLSSIFFVGPKQRLFTGFCIKTVPADVLFGIILFPAPSAMSAILRHLPY